MEFIGIGNDVRAWWKRTKKRATGTSRTRQPAGIRTTRLGSEQVRMTPAMRNALPANQPQGRGQSTARRPVRCLTCGGYFGVLKTAPGRPRAHRDVSKGNRPCPGGGAPKKTGTTARKPAARRKR